MASAAFKSRTKRSTIGGAAEDAGFSNSRRVRRRPRSLSRYSGRFAPPPDSDEFPTPRARFGNKGKGDGFPETSLDLPDEFFGSRMEEDEEEQVRPDVGRSSRRRDGTGYRVETDSFRRRGRSVSRHHSWAAEERKGVLENSSRRKGVSDSTFRRQRSVSGARYRYSDSESHSSALTDDEAWDSCRHGSATEKAMQAVYAQRTKEHLTQDGKETRLYEAMRQEVRHAVEEIRMEIEKMVVKTEPATICNGEDDMSNGSNTNQAIAVIRRNYTTKLEQSEKRILDLLAELAIEEEHVKELTSIARELFPAPKQTPVPERPSWSRRRRNDRTTTSKYLTEEAEKYIEDFLLNMEDTDISSYDEERSETSSAMGGSMKLVTHNTMAETHESLTGVSSMLEETDGVVLPWLQWETSNDGSPIPGQGKTNVAVVSRSNLFPAAQEANGASDNTNYLSSSLGSWSPEVESKCSVVLGDITGSIIRVGNLRGSCSVTRPKGPLFDLDDYVRLQIGEDHLFERFRQKQRIESGSLMLCGRTSI